MVERVTETVHPAARGLDTLPDPDILDRLLAAQSDALAAVAPAVPQIARGARLMAETVRQGGTLIYSGAGSSALMAMADALELPGTFGLAPVSVQVLMAGGMPSSSEMPGGAEDDAAAADLAAKQTVHPGDLVIVVSASGTTPYSVSMAERARAYGARTICMANNPGAPLFEHASVAICLETPPELIAGSTRMGAGTAQKAALNMMSALMGVILGHVHDGLMVNLRADNRKLHDRAARIVSQIADVPERTAHTCLAAAEGAVKPAILLARGVGSLDQAAALLSDEDGNLRAAMKRL